MKNQENFPAKASIALVDGDATIRHARQLMLRAEGSDVRAYPNCEAALDDPAALTSDCVVADVDMGAIGGLDLLRLMRAKGWRGTGILLADIIAPALRLQGIEEGFVVMQPAALDDRRLLTAVDVALGQRALD